MITIRGINSDDAVFVDTRANWQDCLEFMIRLHSENLCGANVLYNEREQRTIGLTFVDKAENLMILLEDKVLIVKTKMLKDGRIQYEVRETHLNQPGPICYDSAILG